MGRASFKAEAESSTGDIKAMHMVYDEPEGSERLLMRKGIS
jgi:hypothetical protein